jgi:hypothetical protein
VSVLEDRLRSELRAESELITPESIVPLRLTGDTERGPSVPRRRGPRQWPIWVIPLAAAAAAAAVIAGTFAIAHALPVSGPRPASPKLSGLPAYYAYTVQGNVYNYRSHGTQYSASVTGRYLKVRDTANGKLLGRVYPPKPYNNFNVIAADASGTLFVLGAMHDFERNANTPPKVLARSSRTPMKFLELRIDAARRPQLSSLLLPVTVTPGQQPSIALSPDGTRLALTFGGGGQPAVLDVISLGTGRARRWVSPPVAWTPLLGPTGAWTADGKTLALQEEDVIRSPSRQAARNWRPPATALVHLIDTRAPGRALAAGKLLVLRPPAHESAPWQVVLTPDGTKLIAVTGKQAFLPLSGTSSGQLSVYSARTGTVIQRRGPWTWHGIRPGRGRFARPMIELSSPSGSQLILLYPQHNENTLSVLTGGSLRTTGSPLPTGAGYQELEDALSTADSLAW